MRDRRGGESLVLRVEREGESVSVDASERGAGMRERTIEVLLQHGHEVVHHIVVV